MPDRRDIEFKTLDGETLRGWFYPAYGAKDATTPGVVISNGFSALKEWGLPSVAERFQAFGFSALVYDQRNTGSSTGTPRQEFLASVQRSDLQDALTFLLSTSPFSSSIDPTRVAVWGWSYSGAHAMNVATYDRRIRAVFALDPTYSGSWLTNFGFPEESYPDFQSSSPSSRHSQQPIVVDGKSFHDALWADRARRIANHGSTEEEEKVVKYVPVTGAEPTGVLTATPDSMEWFNRMAASASEGVTEPWKNRTTLQSIGEMKGYEPVDALRHVSPTPVLLLAAEKSQFSLWEKAVAEVKPSTTTLVPFSGGHFGVFEGTAEVEIWTAIERFLKVFVKWLGGGGDGELAG